MGLSTELISEFVKITNDNKKGKDEKTVYGTVKTVSEDNKSGMVQIDGSDVLTPFTTTCTVKGKTDDYEGDRVRLTVRDHNAIVTGNTTDISASAAELAEALTKFVTVNNEIAEVKVTVGNNSIAISNLGTTVTGLTTFKSNLENGTKADGEYVTTIDGGCIDTTNLNLSGRISFSDLSDSDTYKKKINGAVSDAEGALNTVSGWAHSDDGTFIDGDMIYSDSIYARSIHLDGSLRVYKDTDSDSVGGYLGYDSGFNSTSGIGIRYWKASFDEIVEEAEAAGEDPIIHNAQVVCTNSAARLSYGDPTVAGADFSQFVASGDYAYIEASTAIVFEIDNEQFMAISDHGTYGTFRPHAEAPYTMHLGNASHRWGALYATNGEIQTSDRNYKNSIENLPDKYVILFDNIHPRRFKMNEGTSGRYHVGYIAQEVEEAMRIAGIDSLEFGGFVRDVDADGNEICMLRYGEFDGIRDLKIKQLESRIDELERRLANLETKEVG